MDVSMYHCEDHVSALKVVWLMFIAVQISLSSAQRLRCMCRDCGMHLWPCARVTIGTKGGRSLHRLSQHEQHALQVSGMEFHHKCGSHSHMITVLLRSGAQLTSCWPAPQPIHTHADLRRQVYYKSYHADLFCNFTQLLDSFPLELGGLPCQRKRSSYILRMTRQEDYNV